MPALAELEAAWVDARDDPASATSSTRLLRDYAGRPTPLYLAERLSEARGRAGLAQARGPACTPARTSSTTRSARRCSPSAWASRAIIAETGAGQHGVATATACALLGLECVVYMGTEDMRRQQPNVAAHASCSAPTVEPVEAGARTLKEAASRGDPRLGHERRRHALRDRLGGRPGAVPGDRPRPAARDRRRGARAAARARGAAAATA